MFRSRLSQSRARRLLSLVLALIGLMGSGMLLSYSPGQPALATSSKSAAASKATPAKLLTAEPSLSTGCAPPPPNLISWWPGDGNANDIKGGNHGALMGGATFAPGVVGQAFSFDGVDDYVFIGNPDSLKITGDLTIDAWVKPQDLAEGQVASIVDKWGFDVALDSYIMTLTKRDGIIQLACGIGDGVTGDGGFLAGIVVPHVWSHVAMTYDHTTGKNTLYINGAEVGSRTRPGGIFTSNQNVLIGGEDSPALRRFPGLIDEVGIFDRVLSAEEVQAIFDAGGDGKCRADLSIEKTASPSPDVLAGANLTYTLKVTNNGPSDATNVKIKDTLPAGVTVVSLPSGCTLSGNMVTCNLGNLADGAMRTRAIVVRPTAAGPISNTAAVTATELDPDLTNNSDTVGTTVLPAADLSLFKSSLGSGVRVRDLRTYRIEITNRGPLAATGVTLTDTLPVKVAYISRATSQGSCSVGAPNQTITCNLGTLSKGSTAIVLITVRTLLSGTISNTATVKSSIADPDASNNSFTSYTTVSP